MKAPIVINDNLRIDTSGDLCVYDSIELAERSLEYDDANDDQLFVIDRDGLLLKIVANQDGRGAHLEPAEVEPSHHNTLHLILKDFLVGLGRPKSVVDNMTLDDLLAQAYERDPNSYSGWKRGSSRTK